MVWARHAHLCNCEVSQQNPHWGLLGRNYNAREGCDMNTDSAVRDKTSASYNFIAKGGCSTWLHNTLLAQLTNKITGQLGWQHLTPFCSMSPVTLAPPELDTPISVINFGERWGKPQAASAVCAAVQARCWCVCCLGLLWEGSEAQKDLMEAVVLWWGGTPAMLKQGLPLLV